MIVKLKDKTEIKVDLYALTVGEVRDLLEGKKEKGFDKEDEVIAKAAGITVEQLRALPFPSYRKVVRAFWDCLRDPLKDEDEETKNSVSEST